MPLGGAFAACEALTFAAALKCLKAALLGQSVLFVHDKSVSAAPDAALAFADALFLLEGGSVAPLEDLGGCLRRTAEVEPGLTLLDLDRVAASSDAMLVAGTANAHVARHALRPRPKTKHIHMIRSPSANGSEKKKKIGRRLVSRDFRSREANEPKRTMPRSLRGLS